MSGEHAQYAEKIGTAAKAAATELTALSDDVKSAALRKIASSIREQKTALRDANANDLSAAKQASLAPALIARLELNDKRIESMAVAVEQIAAQVDPVGQTIEGYVRPNGLRIEKRRVPLGVILFFYESRPNVTADAAALCIKSGNAVILRGGKEALHSNRAIANIISTAAADAGLPETCVQLIESTDRTLVPHLLKLDRYIDLVIPRGGESLIRAVVAESTIPVLKHFTGNCHIYIDSSAEALGEIVTQVCVNSKTSYPGGAVCNAVEHLLIHRSVAEKFIPKICTALADKGVEIRGDKTTSFYFKPAIPATDADWHTEYLSPIIGVKVVASLDEAIQHINEHGSHHTDAILASDHFAIERFTCGVDSASVMVNTSTRFADGGEYGLGAEIGISTDKLHARGPMGASDLTTYKWIVTGAGQVRG